MAATRSTPPATAGSSPLPGSRTPAAAAKRTPRSRSTAARPGSASNATAAGSAAGSRKGKFNANGERIDGIWFASEAEGERYRQLKAMEEEGRITLLRTQVKFPLVVNGAKVCGYIADFTYYTLDARGVMDGYRIEDVKGMETPEFKLKAKLFNALKPNGYPLSVIHVLGKARHSTRPRLSDKTGKPIADNKGWMDLHWRGRIPPGLD